jgi:hypothetical protein
MVEHLHGPELGCADLLGRLMAVDSRSDSISGAQQLYVSIERANLLSFAIRPV